MSEIMEMEEAAFSQVSASALAEITRSEVDIQVQTAKRYPRSLRKFTQEALTMATLTPEVAESCFYSLPRGGKPIEGPSARLAEIVSSAWGNLRIAARTIGDDGKFIKCQAVCHDLERNVAAMIEVSRRITDKYGKRYNDDMVNVTANAGTSIAYRNAIFKIVPKAYWWPIYLECRKVAVGDARTLEGKRADMMGYFGKMGVTPDRVIAAVGVAGVEDIGLEHLATLKGFATAIKDGDSTIEDIFPPPMKPEPKNGNGNRKSRTSTLAESLKPKTADTGPAVNTPEGGSTAVPAVGEEIVRSSPAPSGSNHGAVPTPQGGDSSTASPAAPMNPSPSGVAVSDPPPPSEEGITLDTMAQEYSETMPIEELRSMLAKTPAPRLTTCRRKAGVPMAPALDTFADEAIRKLAKQVYFEQNKK